MRRPTPLLGELNVLYTVTVAASWRLAVPATHSRDIASEIMVPQIRRALIAPAGDVRDPAERRQAQLLATLLLALFGFGLASGLLQLALIPGFLPTFLRMLAALAIIAGAYALSRTRRFRVAAWAACLAPLGACFGIVASNSDDVVAAPFMLLGVILASAFLGARATVAMAALAFLALVAALLLRSNAVDPGRALAFLAFHAVVSPLLIITTLHRDGLERLRQAESRRRDAAAREQRQLETLGRLASGIAHDFNNLLLVIQTNAELLDRMRNAPVSDLAAGIREAALRGADLTRQILAAARKQLLEPELLPVNALLAGVARLLRRVIGSHITLQIQPAPNEPAIMADRSQLEQVLINLALNARDAMPHGGTLKITAEPHAATGWIRLSVADTGIGMDAVTLRRIFEPFFTTKGAAGHGLGLATVRGLIEQSGGRIEVTSAPNQGSRFDIDFPLAAEGRPQEPGAAVRRLGAGATPRRATILVIDDDPAVVRAVSALLTDIGHDPLVANSAGEAIDLFEREQHRIDLLLSDIVIPAVNGFDLAALLRRRRPLRVLFMSGYADARLDALLATPTAALISKPFSRDELQARIDRCLSEEARPERSQTTQATTN